MLGSCDEGWPNEFTWYDADLRVGGASFANVGIRKKGFLGSVLGLGEIKPSIKLKTDKYVDGQLVGDTERVTLNNNAQDWTGIRTCLGYDLFHWVGYPAPRCNIASVMVNEHPMGAYSHVEAIKARFLTRAFGDASGSLYEGTLADFLRGYLAGADDGALGRWEAKTDDTDPMGGPLLAVIDALEGPDDGLLDALTPLVNLERFATFWALEVLLGHGDGYSAGKNNFYVYFDPADEGRAVFVPWGVDNVFEDEKDGKNGEEISDLGPYLAAELPRRLARIPSMATRFEDELLRLLDERWVEDDLMAQVDRYASLISQAQGADPMYADEVEELRAFIRERPAQIRALLGAGLPVPEPGTPGCMDWLDDLAKKDDKK
jgi:spore coat protein H